VRWNLRPVSDTLHPVQTEDPANLEFTPAQMLAMGESVLRRLVDHLGTIAQQPSRGDVDATAYCRAMRESVGLARPVIGSVAMFRRSKGHAHLLDAFATVHARHPAARLLLVGDGIRRSWVEGLAKDRGLGEAVVFTGFRADVPVLLRAMDCFVLASTRTEGVPQSLLQAFAAGVPVVASAIGGIPEVVKDGETGILVPPEDAAALARAIESVLSDGSGAAARARGARQLVEKRFSHGASVSRLLALYDEVIAGAAPRPVRA